MKLKLAALTIAMFASCGAFAQATDTVAKVKASGVVTMGVRDSSGALSYTLGEGKYTGYHIDVCNKVIANLEKAVGRKLEVKYQAVTSQNRIPLLVNGTYDLECGSTTNNSTRAKDVSFSTNMFYTGTRLLVKKSSGVKNYADLAKKTVASTTGTTNAQVIRKYTTDKKLDMQLILGKDHDDSLLLVESDRAVAFAMDDILLFGLRANSKNPESLEVVGDSLQVEPYACMVRKDDPEFKKLVDGTINRLMKSGEFSKLYTKWFESAIVPKGVNLALPMSAELKANLKTPTDKPAL